MLLLVTDTSGKHGSVGLVRVHETAEKIDLLQETPLTGGTFSAQLVPQIAALLQSHGFGTTDIEAFIVISGPGSFTGLRVGLAAIKALAEILHKPIVPVSLLEVVAANSRIHGRVSAALDAGRGEVYFGEYEVTNNSARLISEQLISRAELSGHATNGILATPDPSLAAAVQESGASVDLIDRPNVAEIARVGWRKLQSGKTVTPEQLDANYIRRSDAEIFAKPE